MKQYNFEQYSDKWWDTRLGKPSASNAKKMVTSTGLKSKQITDYAIELANDLYVGSPVDAWDGNSHTQRGTELEPDARDYYRFVYNVPILEVGLLSDDQDRYVASPDGLIGDNGLLEIKCCSAKVHTKNIIYYNKNKKAPPDYISQLQMQLFVSGREWVDLLFYHPDLPSIVIRNTVDYKITTMLVGQLAEVISNRDSIIKELKEI